MSGTTAPRVLVYLLRRDLRVADNPALHEISRLYEKTPQPFTHLLPLYIFPARQIEVSGFLSSDARKSPYPEARSKIAGFWRCGPQRAKFIAESVWDVKTGLETLGSGLVVRVGLLGDVVRQTLRDLKADGGELAGLWLTADVAIEEKDEQEDVRKVVESEGAEFRLLKDERYFVDE